MAVTPERPAELADQPPDVEALILEARRRTRRRRLIRASWAALVVGMASGIVLLTAGTQPHHLMPARSSGLAATAGAGVALRAPGSLAVSTAGTLYIVDPQRDQVLRLSPSGKFVVFAGSGRIGFSGDGGPATRAALHLSNSAITVGPGGTVYIADTGNNRVRAVAPNGTIRTALRVTEPVGLAIGPHDQLDVGAGNLFSLSLRTGHLRKLAGWVRRAGDVRITDHEWLESHFSSSGGDIAVDASGDLFEANFPQLYERTATGRLRFLGDGFRAAGAGKVTEGPGGHVYEATFGVGLLSDAGPGPHQLVQLPRSIVPAGKVDRAVGGDWRQLARARSGAIIAPAAGIAVARNGTIYYDSDSGDGWASGALVEITSSRHVHVLWRSPH